MHAIVPRDGHPLEDEGADLTPVAPPPLAWGCRVKFRSATVRQNSIGSSEGYWLCYKQPVEDERKMGIS